MLIVLCWGWALQQGRGGRGAGHSSLAGRAAPGKVWISQEAAPGHRCPPSPWLLLPGSLGSVPQIQGPRAHEETRPEMQQPTQGWALKWLLQLSRPCSAGRGSWHQGISVQALGSFAMAPK